MGWLWRKIKDTAVAFLGLAWLYISNTARLYYEWYCFSPASLLLLSIPIVLSLGILGQEFGVEHLFWDSDSGRRELVAGASLGALACFLFYFSVLVYKEPGRWAALADSALGFTARWWPRSADREGSFYDCAWRVVLLLWIPIGAVLAFIALVRGAELARSVWLPIGAWATALAACLALRGIAWLGRTRNWRDTDSGSGSFTRCLLVFLVPLALYDLALWRGLDSPVAALCLVLALVVVPLYASRWPKQGARLVWGCLLVLWIIFANSYIYKLRFPGLDAYYSPKTPTNSISILRSTSDWLQEAQEAQEAREAEAYSNASARQMSAQGKAVHALRRAPADQGYLRDFAEGVLRGEGYKGVSVPEVGLLKLTSGVIDTNRVWEELTKDDLKKLEDLSPWVKVPLKWLIRQPAVKAGTPPGGHSGFSLRMERGNLDPTLTSILGLEELNGSRSENLKLSLDRILQSVEKKGVHDTDPRNLAFDEALAAAGDLYVQNDRKALERMNSALKKDPKNSIYLYMRGNVRMAIGDSQGAIEDFRNARGKDRYINEVCLGRIGIGELHVRFGMVPKDPQHQADFAKWFTLSDTAKVLHCDEWVRGARELIASQNYVQARVKIQEAICDTPRSCSGRLKKWGEFLEIVERLVRISQARDDAQQVLKEWKNRDLQHASNELAKGFLLLELGEMDEARRSLERAASQDVLDPSAWVGLAKYHRKLNETALADDAQRSAESRRVRRLSWERLCIRERVRNDIRWLHKLICIKPLQELKNDRETANLSIDPKPVNYVLQEVLYPKLFDQVFADRIKAFTDWRRLVMTPDGPRLNSLVPLATGLLDPNDSLTRWRDLHYRSGRSQSIDLDFEAERRNKPVLVVVATSGGGITAAIWTASCLAELEKKVDTFPQHLRIITGASGGMVGAAAYVIGLSSAPPVAAGGEGESGRSMPKKRSPDELDSVVRVVSQDSLSSTASHMMLHDLPSILLPAIQSVDRGLVLERQWEKSWEDNLNLSTLYGLKGRGLSVSDLADGEREGWRPSLIITPMLVESSDWLLISNLNLASLRFGEQFFSTYPASRDSFRLSTALRMNASFPLVSPGTYLPAVTVLGGPVVPPRRVVDAGYLDNFGVRIATAWIDQHRDWILAHASRLVFIELHAFPKDRANGAVVSRFRITFDWGRTPLDAAFGSYRQSMVVRNEERVRELKAWFNDDPDKPTSDDFFRPFVLTCPQGTALGWSLPSSEQEKAKAATYLAQPAESRSTEYTTFVKAFQEICKILKHQ
jgi:tetratricopeptide (TPR) repeat protein